MSREPESGQDRWPSWLNHTTARREMSRQRLRALRVVEMGIAASRPPWSCRGLVDTYGLASRGVQDAGEPSVVPGGVSGSDGRVGLVRALPGGAGAGGRALELGEPQLGSRGGSRRGSPRGWCGGRRARGVRRAAAAGEAASDGARGLGRCRGLVPLRHPHVRAGIR